MLLLTELGLVAKGLSWEHLVDELGVRSRKLGDTARLCLGVSMISGVPGVNESLRLSTGPSSAGEGSAGEGSAALYCEVLLLPLPLNQDNR